MCLSVQTHWPASTQYFKAAVSFKFGMRPFFTFLNSSSKRKLIWARAGAFFNVGQWKPWVFVWMEMNLWSHKSEIRHSCTEKVPVMKLDALAAPFSFNAYFTDTSWMVSSLPPLLSAAKERVSFKTQNLIGQCIISLVRHKHQHTLFQTGSRHKEA